MTGRSGSGDWMPKSGEFYYFPVTPLMLVCFLRFTDASTDITSGARNAERVLRGLVEKSKYERPDTTP